MLVDESNNSITFISPEKIDDVNVNVYEKFNDVSKDAWYEPFLSHLVQLGVINGINASSFAPDDYVTRAQFVAMLASAAKINLSVYSGRPSFDDVDTNIWYAPQVEWAYQQGIVQGRSHHLFCPNSYITREEAAVLMDRYAKITESPVLEQNNYELNDDSQQRLTLQEYEELKQALDTPEYDDSESISLWAEEEVDAMTRAGIFNGNEISEFNPQQPLRRSESVKVISTYILFDTKPTLIFPGGSSISYIDTGDAEDITLTDEELIDLGFDFENLDTEMADLHGPNFYCEVPIMTTEVSNGATLSWAAVGHQTLTDKAFELLKQNTGEGGRTYIYNKMQEPVGYNNLLRTGKYWVHYYSWYADKIAEENGPKVVVQWEINPINSFEAHFYNPDTGKSWTGSTTRNAYTFFNNHFYNAITNARITDNNHRYLAYKELGLAIHYLEDLNNPYHASNKIAGATNHAQYEAWADTDSVRNCTTTMTYQSYRYVYDSTFIAMSNNFAGLAKATYHDCSLFNSSSAALRATAKNKTQDNLARTQRAVCGLLNRFYYNGQLNSH